MNKALNEESRKNVINIVLQTRNHQNIVDLFRDGYCLTAEALEILYRLKMGKNTITECVRQCTVYEDSSNLYNWLVGYLGQNAAEELIIKSDFDDCMLEKISPQTLEKCQEWEILGKIGQNEILEKNNKLEYCEGKYLLEQRHYDIFFQKFIYFNYADVSDPVDVFEYLIANQMWDVVKGCIPYSQNEKLTQKVLDIVNEEGAIKQVADSKLAKYLPSYPEGVVWLKEKKFWQPLATHKKFVEIDLEDYYTYDSYAALLVAEELKKWDFLEKHKAYKLLLKHGKFIRFIRALVH